MKKTSFFVLISFLLSTTFSFAMHNEVEHPSVPRPVAPAREHDDTTSAASSSSPPSMKPDLKRTQEIAQAWNDYNKSWYLYALTGLWEERLNSTSDSEEERINLLFSKGSNLRTKKNVQKNFRNEAEKVFYLKEMQEACRNDCRFSSDFLKCLNDQQENLPDALHYLCRLYTELLNKQNTRGMVNSEMERDWIILLQASLEPYVSKTIITLNQLISYTILPGNGLRISYGPGKGMKPLKECVKWYNNFQSENASHDTECPFSQYFKQIEEVSKLRGLILAEVAEFHQKLARIAASPNILRNPSLFAEHYSTEELPKVSAAIYFLYNGFQEWQLPIIPTNESCCSKQHNILRQQEAKERAEMQKKLSSTKQTQVRQEKTAPKAHISKNEDQFLSVPMGNLDLAVEQQGPITPSQTNDSKEMQLSSTQEGRGDTAPEATEPLLMGDETYQTPSSPALELEATSSPTLFLSVRMVTSTDMPTYKEFLAQLHRDFKEKIEIQRSGAPTLIRMQWGNKSAIVAFDPPHGKALEKKWPQWRCQFKKLFDKLGLSQGLEPSEG